MLRSTGLVWQISTHDDCSLLSRVWAVNRDSAMKVLIVEDEVRIREGIGRLLSRSGGTYEVVMEAGNGMEGLKAILELKPDIVITDIRMPDMDGLEMLGQMVKSGIHTKAIVLSAYSEFEYARTAMKLGVTEYLLKPIAYNELMQALENVSFQLEKERQAKPEQIGTPEQIFFSILSGKLTADQQTEDYLENRYHISCKEKMSLLCAYHGENVSTEEACRYFRHVFSAYEGLDFYILDLVYRNTVTVVLRGYSSLKDLERWVQQQILQRSPRKMAVGWIEVDSLRSLGEGFSLLYPWLDWNISMNHKVLICYPEIRNIQTSSCNYPIELETKMKAAICADDQEKEQELMGAFHAAFCDGKIYAPKEIKESYVRFLWNIIAIAKEVGKLHAAQIDQQELLNRIMNAKLRDELLDASSTVLQALLHVPSSDTTHLTVKRMKSMIHEFYQTGIMLDEISRKLDMTPEYLGTLFHKETGTTFSTYLKAYRIAKAKELLVGTNLKLYEIAARVGYSDSKYFSRIFKEMTGQLPTEYRRSVK